MVCGEVPNVGNNRFVPLINVVVIASTKDPPNFFKVPESRDMISQRYTGVGSTNANTDRTISKLK